MQSDNADVQRKDLFGRRFEQIHDEIQFLCKMEEMSQSNACLAERLNLAHA